MQLAKHVEFQLNERYTRSGTVFMSGIQALVRALLLQRDADERAGLRSAGFVSGYRGSPLGVLDKELWSQKDLLDGRDVRFQPGVNEDLAATAVWGTQQVGLFPGATNDGVFGLWYGKAPGLDRSCDAIRHANMAGVAPKGGVLLVVGDDHGAKSSSLANHSEYTLKDLGVPVLNPADVQDVVDFAVAGWAMSRYSGCWSGLIALADTMDSAATVDIHPERHQFSAPRDDVDVHIRLEDSPAEQEQRLLEQKLQLAVEFARSAGLNRTVGNTEGPAKLAIVTTGKAYLDLREALAMLGLVTDAQLDAAGFAIMKLGLSWPLDVEAMRELAGRSQTLLVVEEKRAFVETELKDTLYGLHNAPPVFGKRDPAGNAFIPVSGELDSAHLAGRLASLLPEAADSRLLDRLAQHAKALERVHAPVKRERIPLFCAGCPHNTSTRVPEGSRANAGIGCHYMALWMDRSTSCVTQMGGEGANWVGQAPFTEESHIFVNLGDGTYFHSGLLAIRQAVAANVNVTYKILYNDAVAMTGGQPADGNLSVERIIAQLRAEGVPHIEVVSDEPDRHNKLDVAVTHRSKLDDVQRQLRDRTGVSVLIYEQTCATELRRRRKRGVVADERPRVLINDAVCEGCGDCSAKSSCVAVEPVPTEFGTKRRINQTSCNKDLSCVDGFCPAFVLVSGATKKAARDLPWELAQLKTLLPQPDFVTDNADLLITGVGGTGIVTLSAMLGVAAHVEGKHAQTLDMTGLAQKGGAVFAHVRISAAGDGGFSPKVRRTGADLLLATDLVTAASTEALGAVGADTVAVVNTHVSPTADFVLAQNADVQLTQRLKRVRDFVGGTHTVDAERLANRLLGDAQQQNLLMLGYAYQLGSVPLAIDSIETAIHANGVAVEANLLAFHLGRMAAHDERALPATTRERGVDVMDPARERSFEELVRVRADHLRAYQDNNLARRFTALVEKVAQAEQALRPGAEQLSRAVAVSYAKVLSYKDEYEVARLYSDGRWADKVERKFADGAKQQLLLAPPMLGQNKRKFGSWMLGAFNMLQHFKGLRGTRFDPFGYTTERRQERELISHFEAVVDELLDALTLQNLPVAVRVVQLALTVRGFGHVKLAALERMYEKEAELLAEFHQPPTPVVMFDPLRSVA